MPCAMSRLALHLSSPAESKLQRPEKPSGRGQAFNRLEKNISLSSRDSSTPPASAGFAQDDRRPSVLELSGLEPLRITPEIGFAVIGERTNITGSPKLSKLILAGDHGAGLAVARQQVQGGANVLDVSLDEGVVVVEPALVRCVNVIVSEPEIARSAS